MPNGRCGSSGFQMCCWSRDLRPPSSLQDSIDEMKCKNKTASCNDETCPFDEMFGLKEDPPSQE